LSPSVVWDVKQQKLMVVVILEQPIGPMSRIKKFKEFALEVRPD
jgi:hypothetical protein